MSEVLSRLFFAGFVRLHVLYHAAEERICGVDIVAELAQHGYRLSPGTIYPVLHELEQAGYLTSQAEVVSGRQRKYYEATAPGREALEAAKEKLRELAAEVLRGERPDRKSPLLVLHSADLEMDLLERRVTRGGVELPLTHREFELLHYLLRHESTPVTREMLLREVWKEPGEEITNVLSVSIRNLRKKVEKPGQSKLIETLPGVGYMLRG
jgi:DNA-binding PadR family transcriptional regulator